MNEEIKQILSALQDPFSHPQIAYWWIGGLAIWGGIVRIIREVKLGGKTCLQIVGIFVGEIIVSGFVGALTFFLCVSADFSPLLTAVMTGIAGHMGGRALTILETIYQFNLKGKG